MNEVHYSSLLHKQEQIRGNGSNVVVSMTVQPDIFWGFFFSMSEEKKKGPY